MSITLSAFSVTISIYIKFFFNSFLSMMFFFLLKFFNFSSMIDKALNYDISPYFWMPASMYCYFSLFIFFVLGLSNYK